MTTTKPLVADPTGHTPPPDRVTARDLAMALTEAARASVVPLGKMIAIAAGFMLVAALILMACFL